jgi:protein-S-isoprenylcysteine O-methyltransferase Ste14
LLGGLAVGRAGFNSLRRAGTDVTTRRRSTTLVMTGPYRITRNPLYLSMTLMYSGIAVLANSLSTILLLPGVLAVMNRGVIDREEEYLERCFGDEYLRYKARVRRWI